MSENPAYGVYIHARKQLERMLVELGYPCPPPASKREWVDIGLMAAKELESADHDFANALMDADYDFKHADEISLAFRTEYRLREQTLLKELGL